MLVAMFGALVNAVTAERRLPAPVFQSNDVVAFIGGTDVAALAVLDTIEHDLPSLLAR